MTGFILNGFGIWPGISSEKEGKGDLLTIELAALLHDISDPKFNDGDEEKGSQLAFRFPDGKGTGPGKGRTYPDHYQACVL